MNTSIEIVTQPVERAKAKLTVTFTKPRAWAAVPVAVGVAFAIHFWAARNQPLPETRLYSIVLGSFFAAYLLAVAVQPVW